MLTLVEGLAPRVQLRPGQARLATPRSVAHIRSTMPRTLVSPFTPPERDLIRLELMPRFGQEPELANGLFLRTWRDGPHKGEPKIPKAIQTMLDRWAGKVGTNAMGRPAALFTEAGFEGLRQLLPASRAMDH